MQNKKQFSDCAVSFCLDIYKKCAELDANDSVCLSSTSILLAMSMLQVGARNKTKDELTEVLKLSTNNHFETLDMMKYAVCTLERPSRHVQLKVANKLYPSQLKTIMESYINLIREYFSSDVKCLDFASAAENSRQEINQWVANKTENKIKEVIPTGCLDSLTELVIVNAIYFRGNWATPFKKRQTRKMNFNSPTGSIQIDMMTDDRMTDVNFTESRELLCKALELPYQGDRKHSMIFILPDSKDGIDALEKQLTRSSLIKLIGDLDESKVKVAIPKFRIEQSFKLKPLLKALGLREVFNPDTADLSGTSDKKRLHLSEVFHSAFVDVNEKGTEASAATAAVEKDRCLPDRRGTFIADHPFVFMIWDHRLQAPLFVGRLIKPEVISSPDNVDVDDDSKEESEEESYARYRDRRVRNNDSSDSDDYRYHTSSHRRKRRDRYESNNTTETMDHGRRRRRHYYADSDNHRRSPKRHGRRRDIY